MSKRRVVITGLGVVSPVGNDVKNAWGNILAGKSGIGPLTNFDATDFPVRFCGEIRDFDVTDYIKAKDARRMGAFIHYGIAAACQAIRDAGLDPRLCDRDDRDHFPYGMVRLDRQLGLGDRGQGRGLHRGLVAFTTRRLGPRSSVNTPSAERAWKGRTVLDARGVRRQEL